MLKRAVNAVRELLLVELWALLLALVHLSVVVLLRASSSAVLLSTAQLSARLPARSVALLSKASHLG